MKYKKLTVHPGIIIIRVSIARGVGDAEDRGSEAMLAQEVDLLDAVAAAGCCFVRRVGGAGEVASFGRRDGGYVVG